MEAIYVDSKNPYLTSDNGILYSKDKTILVSYPANYSQTKYVMPDNVCEMSFNAFYGAKNLKEIQLSEKLGVSTYSVQYFLGCEKLESINVPESNNDFYTVDGVLFRKRDFDGLDNPSLISYPQNKKDSKYEVPKTVKSIERSAFEGNTNLSTVIIPDNVEEINYSAFMDCTSLSKVVLPSNLKEIAYYTFSNCSSLTDIDIPASITTVGACAFLNCSSLKNVTIPFNVTEIMIYAFGYRSESPDFNVYQKKDNFKIYCYSGTAGEQYAKDNGFDYELITAEKPANVTGFKVKSIFSTNVTLQWNKNANASGYGNVLRINEIIIIDYDFEAVTEIKAVVSGFHGGSKLSDVSVASGEPEKYSLTINNIRDVYGNNIVNDIQLCKGFKYNIFVKVKLKSGYVAAYTTGTVKMRRFEDPANEWQAADHIYIGLNEIAFKSVLVCDEGIRTVGVEISNFLPYRQVNDLQLTSSEPDKYSVTLVTPLLNTWEYNEEVYDDDELIVDNCYVVEFKVTPKSGYALSPGYIFRCRLDTYREGFWLTSEDKELFTVSNDGKVVINSLRVPFEEYDKDIYVQITPPKAGGTPAKSFISHNLPEHMSLISIDWYDDEEWKTPTVFEKGKTYWCYIYINADCYEYNLKKAKFYLNGTQVRQDYSYNSKYKYYYILGYTEIKIENDVATPTGFAAESATSSSISLKWDKNANASGYEIEQYKGGKWTQIAKINNSSTVSYNVSRLAADTTYTFRMRAYKTLSSGTSYSDYVRLAAKTQLTNTDKFVGTAISPTAVKLDWNRNDKVTGYIIEQYKGGKWTQIAVTKNNTTLTFTVKGLADATPYSFRIKTYKNADGKTNYSGYTTVKAETPPAAVKNARVTSTTATWITLEWERNANVTGYAIEQYKGGKWTQIAVTKNNTTLKFIVKGLNPDTKYSFRIRAYKTNGTKTTYGGYVSMAGTTRIANVAKFNATALSQVAVKLSWSRNTIASGYVIEQYKGGKWTQINVIKDKNVTTMVVAPLAKGTTYSFRMKSFKTVDGSNRFSEYISAKATTAK